MLRGHFILLAILSIVLLSACTRAEEESTSVSISIPDLMKSSKSSNQSLSAQDEIAHVIINLSGPGISPTLTMQWDSCRDCAGIQAPAPSKFEFKEVPPGSDRIIQVLVVYENSITKMTHFYYGDVTKSIMTAADGDVPLSISPFPANDNLTSISGRIAGRYLMENGVAPTGKIQVMFNPGAGKNKMIIERATMIAGWFQMFGLDNVNLEYYLTESFTGNKTLLFGQAVSLNSPLFNPSDRVVKAAIPVHQYSSGGGGWFDSSADIYVWGWFGDATAIASKKVKKELSASEQFTIARKKKLDGSALFAEGLGLTFHSKADILDASKSTGGFSIFAKFLGGVNSSGVAGLTYLQDYLMVIHQMIENGNDNSAGFRGPFQFMSSTNLFNIATDGNFKDLSGKVLPGVQSAVDHFRAYKKVGVGNDYHMDNVLCGPQGPAGFVPADSAGPSSYGASDSFTMQIDVSPGDVSAGTAVVLCAVKNGVTYESGAFLGPYMFMNYGPVQGGIATQLKMLTINGDSGTITTSRDVCLPLLIKALDSSNMPAGSGFPMTVNLTQNSASQFYSDFACAQAPVTSFSMGMNSQTIYVKLDSAITAIGAAAASLASANLGINPMPAGSPDKIKFFNPQNLLPVSSVTSHACMPVLAVITDANGYPASTNASGSYQATLAVDSPISGQAITAYTAGDCSSGSETANIPFSVFSGADYYATSANISLRYSPSIGAAETSVTLNAALNSGSPASVSSLPLSVTHVGAGTQLSVQVLGLGGPSFMNVPRGICVPVRFKMLDAAGNMVPFTGTGTLTYSGSASSASPVTFHFDHYCGSALASISVTAGDLTKTAWMKVAGSPGGSETLQLTANYNSFNASWPQSGSAANIGDVQFFFKPITSSPLNNASFIQNSNCVGLQVEMQMGGQPYHAFHNMQSVVVTATGGAANPAHFFYGSNTCTSTFASGTASYYFNKSNNSTAEIYYKNSDVSADEGGLKTFAISTPNTAIVIPTSTRQASIGLLAHFTNNGALLATDLGSGYTCLSGIKIEFKDHFNLVYTGSMGMPSGMTWAPNPLSIHDGSPNCSGTPSWSAGVGIISLKFGSSFVYPTPLSSYGMNGITVSGTSVSPSGSITLPNITP